MPVLPPSMFSFFTALAAHNKREWFDAHKPEFKALEQQVKQWGEALKDQMNTHNSIDRFKLFRIYRDVRFSKDKTPYKTHFGLTWHRTKPHYRGGYYLHIKPGDCFLAAGFWDPHKDDLFRIRKELEVDAEPLRTLLKEPQFVKTWGGLQGEELKTAPKNFDKDHPAIDLIRKKQYLFVAPLSEEQVVAPDFIQTVDAAFVTLRPVLDYFTEVLTTDLNGVSLLE